MWKNTRLADSRQKFPGGKIEQPCSADGGFHDDPPLQAAVNDSDDCRITPERMGAHDLERSASLFPWNHGDNFAFICYVQRIEAEKLAYCGGLSLYRDCRLLDQNTQAGC